MKSSSSLSSVVDSSRVGQKPHRTGNRELPEPGSSRPYQEGPQVPRIPGVVNLMFVISTAPKPISSNEKRSDNASLVAGGRFLLKEGNFEL